jgi:hypothetical protein
MLRILDIFRKMACKIAALLQKALLRLVVTNRKKILLVATRHRDQ